MIGAVVAMQAVGFVKAVPRDYRFRMDPTIPEKRSDRAVSASPKRQETWTEAVKTDSASTGAEAENPKVEPGAVTWHASFADACEAAKESGKPVLLFQMMGKLDQRFC
jgi:hypothetical protein